MNKEMVKIGLGVCGGAAFRSFVHRAFKLAAETCPEHSIVTHIGEIAMEAASFVCGYGLVVEAANLVDQKAGELKAVISGYKDKWHVTDSEDDDLGFDDEGDDI